MANKIILKKSSVTDKIPTDADLAYGELALNYTDGKLYYKTSSDVIQPISSKVTMAAVSPESPFPSDLWWDTESGNLKLYYNDGTTPRWVEAFTSLYDASLDKIAAEQAAQEAKVASAAALSSALTAEDRAAAAEVAVAAALTHAQTAALYRNDAGAFADDAQQSAQLAQSSASEVVTAVSGPNIAAVLAISNEINTLATNNVVNAITTVANNTTNINLVASGVIRQRVVLSPDSQTFAVNIDTTDVAVLNNTQVSGTLSILTPSGTPFSFQKIVLQIKTTNTQTISWSSDFISSAELPLPIVTYGSGKIDYFGFVYNISTAKWQLMSKLSGF